MAIRMASREGCQTRLRDRPWNDQAAIVEKERAEQRDALPRRRQRREHGEIPEQDLEQHRQISHQLDIAAGNARQQPVRRQPAQRHQEADDGGEKDADDGNQQRIEQADQEYAGIGVRSGIRNQALADVETGIMRQEAKAGGDALRLQIGAGVGDDLVADPDQRRDKQQLQDKPAPAGAAAKRTPQSGNKLRRWWSGRGRSSPPPRALRSADRRRVLNSALVPELVEPARDPELGAGADVTIEGLAVIADRLDDPRHPILGHAERLAEIAVGAQ